MMLVSLVPLGIIALLVYLNLFNSQQLARDSVDESRTEMQQKVVAVNLKNQASSMALELTGSMGDRMLDLMQMMSMPTITDILTESGSEAVANAFLEHQNEILSHFTEISVIDNESIVLASTNRELMGEELISESWWDPSQYISLEIVKDEHLVRLVIYLPVWDSLDAAESFNSMGWIVGVSELSSQSIVSAYTGYLEQGRMTVFWGDQLMADSNEPKRPFQDKLILTNAEQIAFSDISEVVVAGSEGQERRLNSGFINDDQTNVVAAYFRPGADELATVMPEMFMKVFGSTLNTSGRASQKTITVVVEQPKDVAFAPLASLEELEDNLESNTNDTLMASIWVIIGVFLMVLLVSFWLTRTLTQPIMNLHHGVREVIGGNLEHRVGRKGEDEISQLSRAFDSMTDSVKESQQMLAEVNAMLEETVEERTQELKHEIDVRKRAEEESHISADKLNTIFDSIGDGIFVVNLNGDIMDVNLAQVRMLGYASKEDLLGKSAAVFVAPKDRDRISKTMNEAFTSEIAPEVMEFTAIKSDSSEIEMEISSAVLKDSFGDVLGFVTITRDITEKKEMARQVKEQTAMLIQSEKMSSVGTMVAGVAHELNNPLTGIMMYAQHCMKRTDESDRRYGVLDDIVKEARRCSEIVQNMLTFSRMEGETAEDYPKASIPDLVEKVVSLLAYRVRAEHVEVIQEFPENMPEISMKANSIQQVLLNLIGNAIDAMSVREKKEIRISGRVKHQFAQIEVSDTGEGIPPEVLEQVFKPFFTTKPSGKGTGLGLAISRSICRQHGGDLLCRTEVGVGTVFTLWLPVEGVMQSKQDSA